jgi:hypothetical protein
MALTDKKVQHGGWQYQAERLALTHTAATAAAAEQARSRRLSKPVSCHFQSPSPESECGLETGIITVANTADPSCAELAEPERQAAREVAAAWVLNARRETLAARTARAAAADKRIAELEDELNATREELALRENENQSLQTSLDLVVAENSRRSVAEIDLLDELEQTKMALFAAEAERNELAFSVDIAIDTRQVEINRLSAHLGTIGSDFKLLQISLRMKELQVQKLEEAHLGLVADAKRELEISEKRDTALVDAKERINLLTKLFGQLETKSGLAKSQPDIGMQGERKRT